MQRIHPFGTLKARMTIIVCALVFLSGILLSIYAVNIVERDMTRLVGDREYALLSSAAAQMEQDLQSKRAVLRVTAEGMRAAQVARPAAVRRHLEQIPSLDQQFFNTVAIDAKGTLMSSLSGGAAAGQTTVAAREYFQQTVATRRGLLSRPLRSALSGKPVVLLTEPVFNAAGTLQFVLAASIDLSQADFFRHLDRLTPGRHGYMFVVTTEGVILHHPDARRLLRNVADEEGGIVPSTRQALAGMNGWVLAKNKAGVDSLIGYRRLATADWIVGIVYPTAEAFAPLVAMRQRALLRTGIAAAVAGLLGLFAIVVLLRPLETLRRQVASIRRGDAGIDIIDLARRDEVGALSRAIHALTEERARAEAESARLASTDSLTGLCNRRMMECELDKALMRLNRTRTGIGVAFLDIDHFKQINDSHGHAAGDAVLVEFARRLKLAVRGTDLVARYAGDEFVVVFEGLYAVDELPALGGKIVEAMHVPFDVIAGGLPVTTSVGLAFGGADSTRESLLKCADEALYVAKAAGRNGFFVDGVVAKACGVEH
ncbi:sensor domain-containing diguanylate cyclase [Pseudoduganella albidiflava]|uniref:Diguanylate cyclase n=1 Tax=Pseudoduganella albidiflava TaxID=321983 RepID=A0A411WWI2_9BURK|nr:sensor domain-containing diguanylate cyclase [Pseudoduganella albidiflava]QBI00857.1 diguanylate cyclase [Pseudoduganella albidiflava]GGY30209.1 sensor domain-containing diguanylate cyclase [Pseudoduganella albidiflava]